jgi:hypothetical protein
MRHCRQLDFLSEELIIDTLDAIDVYTGPDTEATLILKRILGKVGLLTDVTVGIYIRNIVGDRLQCPLRGQQPR